MSNTFSGMNEEQLSEMLGKDGPSQSSDGNSTESQTQRKSSIVDWVSIRPRVVSEEEKQHWVQICLYTLSPQVPFGICFADMVLVYGFILVPYDRFVTQSATIRT